MTPQQRKNLNQGRATTRERYGPDFYKEIGRLGGLKSRPRPQGLHIESIPSPAKPVRTMHEIVEELDAHG